MAAQEIVNAGSGASPFICAATAPAASRTNSKSKPISASHSPPPRRRRCDSHIPPTTSPAMPAKPHGVALSKGAAARSGIRSKAATCAPQGRRVPAAGRRCRPSAMHSRFAGYRFEPPVQGIACTSLDRGKRYAVRIDRADMRSIAAQAKGCAEVLGSRTHVADRGVLSFIIPNRNRHFCQLCQYFLPIDPEVDLLRRPAGLSRTRCCH